MLVWMMQLMNIYSTKINFINKYSNINQLLNFAKYTSSKFNFVNGFLNINPVYKIYFIKCIFTISTSSKFTNAITITQLSFFHTNTITNILLYLLIFYTIYYFKIFILHLILIFYLKNKVYLRWFCYMLSLLRD